MAADSSTSSRRAGVVLAVSDLCRMIASEADRIVDSGFVAANDEELALLAMSNVYAQRLSAGVGA